MKLNPKYNGRYVEGPGGTRLFVEENGDPTRPTILWIHGYCQCRLSWDRQFENEQLASRFHLVRLDLRGHGLSDKPTDPAWHSLRRHVELTSSAPRARPARCDGRVPRRGRSPN